MHPKPLPNCPGDQTNRKNIPPQRAIMAKQLVDVECLLEFLDLFLQLNRNSICKGCIYIFHFPYFEFMEY